MFARFRSRWIPCNPLLLSNKSYQFGLSGLLACLIGRLAVDIPQWPPNSGICSTRGQVLTDLDKLYLLEIWIQTLFTWWANLTRLTFFWACWAQCPGQVFTKTLALPMACLRLFWCPCVPIPWWSPDSGRFSSLGQVFIDLSKLYLLDYLHKSFFRVETYKPAHQFLSLLQLMAAILQSVVCMNLSSCFWSDVRPT